MKRKKKGGINLDVERKPRFSVEGEEISYIHHAFQFNLHVSTSNTPPSAKRNTSSHSQRNPLTFIYTLVGKYISFAVDKKNTGLLLIL